MLCCTNRKSRFFWRLNIVLISKHISLNYLRKSVELYMLPCSIDHFLSLQPFSHYQNVDNLLLFSCNFYGRLLDDGHSLFLLIWKFPVRTHLVSPVSSISSLWIFLTSDACSIPKISFLEHLHTNLGYFKVQDY